MSTTTIPTGGGDPATRPRTPAAGGVFAAGRRRAYAGERSLCNGVVALIVIFNAVLLVYPIVQEDAKRREAAEVRNEADAAVFAAEKLMNDLGDKMSAEEKGKVNAKLDELRRAIEANDGAKMKSAREELEKTIQEFSTRLYQAAGQEGPNASDASASAGSGGASSSDGDTVDAEFSDQGQA